MSSSTIVKKNLSSLQVLKTLKVLLEGEYSMSELVQILNSKEKDSIFNSSVISKYINTCRYCGIEIYKLNNKYFISKLPFGINLTDYEASLIEKMQIIINKKMSARSNKLNIYSNKNLVKIAKRTEVAVYDIFEQAINEERKILITFKNDKILKCIPTAIAEKGDKTYFEIFHDNEKKSVSMDSIRLVELLNERYCRNLKNNDVVFTLKGGLAKRYTLRENEKVILSEDNTITILNTGENPDELISRLLRYDSDCEITQPVELREKIKNIINQTLKNYGE